MKAWKNVPVVIKERKAIKAAASLLKSKFPVNEVILFGSKARGTYNKHSDIDLLLITSRPSDWKEEKCISGDLFEIGLKYDVIFSPLFVSSDEWEHGIFLKFPIYQEIMKEGSVVA